MKEAWELFERASLLEERERESESFLACRACLEGNLYLPKSSWWFDALKSTFDLSSKCCWRTLMGRLGLIQQSFVLCRLQALMKEAWELLRELPCLKNLSWRKFVSPGIPWWFNALKSTFDVSSKCCWRTLMGRLGLIQQSFVLCRLQA
jgi:hypothetical protein